MAKLVTQDEFKQAMAQVDRRFDEHATAIERNRVGIEQNGASVRRNGVLLEAIDHKLDLVLEVLDYRGEHVADHEDRIAALEGDVTTLKDAQKKD